MTYHRTLFPAPAMESLVVGKARKWESLTLPMNPQQRTRLRGLPSPRDNVLGFVEELAGLQAPKFRICVTSRPEDDIEPVLSPLSFRSVSLHGENGQARDIAEYIRFVVSTDPNMRKWRQADKEHVIKVLTEKADGM